MTCRLDVAVDDSRLVGGGECLRDLTRDGQAVLELQPVSHHLTKRPALDELHRNELEAAGFTDFVDGNQVRVIQR